jgi:hypothetical protein
VVVNRDGSGQVTSLTVTFSEVVNFDLTSAGTSPFLLIRGRGKGLAMPLHVSSSVVNGATVAVLAIPGVHGGTIPFPHSPYTLTIKGANATYGIGQFLDGGGNGTQKSNFVLRFSA